MKLDVDLNKLDVDELEAFIKIAKKQKQQTGEPKEFTFNRDESSDQIPCMGKETYSKLTASKPEPSKEERLSKDIGAIKNVMRQATKPLSLYTAVCLANVKHVGNYILKYKKEIDDNMWGYTSLKHGTLTLYVSSKNAEEYINKKQKSPYFAFISNRIKHYMHDLNWDYDHALPKAKADFRELKNKKEAPVLNKPINLPDDIINMLKNELVNSNQISPERYHKFMSISNKVKPTYEDLCESFLMHSKEIESMLGVADGTLMIKNNVIVRNGGI